MFSFNHNWRAVAKDIDKAYELSSFLLSGAIFLLINVSMCTFTYFQGYTQPWEDSSFEYPTNFASPLEIAIEASNGASDYGNKFGEPVLAGFARSFGMELVAGDRREYIKPIMFSGGVGQLEGSHISKQDPSRGKNI